MDYARQSKISDRSKGRDAFLASLNQRLAKLEDEHPVGTSTFAPKGWIANGTAFLSILIATVALWIAVDFNDWQRSSAERNRIEENNQMAASLRELLIDRCYRIATDGANLAKGLSAPAAARILEDYGRREPRCAGVGIDLPRHMAGLIINAPKDYPEAVVLRSRKLQASQATEPTPIQATQNTEATLSFPIVGMGPRGPSATHVTEDELAALGGEVRYMRSARELEIPLGKDAHDIGLRPSVVIDSGISWVSAFGPFRLDILHKQASDKTAGRKSSIPKAGTYF